MRWHRAGFRSYWRWESRRRPSRPAVSDEICQLIRDMTIANPFWGAPRIHGELLKLGIDVGQTSVAKYMARRRESPSHGWKTFLHNHADGIAAMDLFVVPTVSFRLLYGLLIMGHSRRRILVAWCHGTSDRRMASQPAQCLFHRPLQLRIDGRVHGVSRTPRGEAQRATESRKSSRLPCRSVGAPRGRKVAVHRARRCGGGHADSVRDRR